MFSCLRNVILENVILRASVIKRVPSMEFPNINI